MPTNICILYIHIRICVHQSDLRVHIPPLTLMIISVSLLFMFPFIIGILIHGFSHRYVNLDCLNEGNDLYVHAHATTTNALHCAAFIRAENVRFVWRCKIILSLFEHHIIPSTCRVKSFSWM